MSTVKSIGLVGLRHESKSEHERRVPLVPADLKDVIKAPQSLMIQPSGTRCIDIGEFEAIGAKVDADMSACDLIMGIKEVPVDELIANKSYCFFSHVIKGQPYNMPLLKKVMDLKCNLIDYEKMVNDKGQRVVAFGKQAGQCGTLNGFHSLNHRLAALKRTNPFAICKQAKDYPNLTEAKADLAKVGADIAANGLPADLTPFVVGVTGKGNVGSGVFDVMGALGCVKEWTPAEMLANIASGDYDNKTVYQVVMDAGDLYELKENPDASAFTFQAFGEAPEKYTSPVSKFLPHMNMFINAVFWRNEWPKFITQDFMSELWQKGNCKLLVISDVTCDIEGSVEVTIKSTLPDVPSFVYHPVTKACTDGFEGEGVVVMAVDILPSEQPYESSCAFSGALKPLMGDLLAADFSVPFAELSLPPVWKGACIVYHGELTPDYEYLKPHIAEHAA